MVLVKSANLVSISLKHSVHIFYYMLGQDLFRHPVTLRIRAALPIGRPFLLGSYRRPHRSMDGTTNVDIEAGQIQDPRMGAL
jgi:hypothetical protein